MRSPPNVFVRKGGTGTMYLIVGLGNPGQQYAHTRHNVGFDVMAVLEKKLGVTISREKGYSQTADCFVDGQKVILALPQTYMNLSGLAVRELMDYYKIPPENVLVIYDDIDIPQGTVRIGPTAARAPTTECVPSWRRPARRISPAFAWGWASGASAGIWRTGC